jgi:hypothetical protein
LSVLLDGKPVGEARGADVGPDGMARVDRAIVNSALLRPTRLTSIVSERQIRWTGNAVTA